MKQEMPNFGPTGDWSNPVGETPLSEVPYVSDKDSLDELAEMSEPPTVSYGRFNPVTKRNEYVMSDGSVRPVSSPSVANQPAVPVMPDFGPQGSSEQVPSALQAQVPTPQGQENGAGTEDLSEKTYMQSLGTHRRETSKSAPASPLGRTALYRQEPGAPVQPPALAPQRWRGHNRETIID